MSIDVETVEINERDLETVARFLSCQQQGNQQSRAGGASGLDYRLLRWFLVDNPARADDIPLGWAMRKASGEIVGTMLCVPQRFCFRDEIYTLVMSGAYYVDEPWRGLGLSLFMRYLQIGKRHALFATTANAQSGALWKRFEAYSIPHTDHELFGIVRWRPMLEEIVARVLNGGMLARGASLIGAPFLGLARRLHTGMSNRGELVRLQSLDDVANLRLSGQCEKLTAVRDSDFIKWRYFSGHDSTQAVFAFRGEGVTNDCLVTVNEKHRGYRAQLKVLNVLDIWGDVTSASIATIAALLVQYYLGEIDAVVFRCQSVERQQCLISRGFVRRKFQIPIGWCIDRFGILPTNNWYLVPADGDMMI